MKIVGTWSGHDCSFCILDNGHPVVHAEFERYIREKEPRGDSLKFLMDVYGGFDAINHIASCFPKNKLQQHSESYNTMAQIVQKNEGKIFWLGNHQAHAEIGRAHIRTPVTL